MKLVNANIKTKEEALKRMIDGEVFYSGDGRKIYCEMKEPQEVRYFRNVQIPSFLIKNLNEDRNSFGFTEEQFSFSSVETSLEFFKNLMVEEEKWYENLGRGKFCKKIVLSDEAVFVTKYDPEANKVFITAPNDILGRWRWTSVENVIPMTLEEIKQYIV